MSTDAIILFAHGAREPEWAQPFVSVRDRLRATGMRVELAFLEIMSPSLDEVAQSLVSEGHRAMTIVPLFLGQGKHLKRQLPELIAAMREKHANVEFRTAPALGDAPEIVAAIAQWAERASR